MPLQSHCFGAGSSFPVLDRLRFFVLHLGETLFDQRIEERCGLLLCRVSSLGGVCSGREFLDYKGIEGVGALSTKKRLLVQKAFEEYWETGGFPEVAGLSRHLRIKTRQEYFHTLLFRDLVERHDGSHPKAVTDLAHWLVDNTASLYSVNSLLENIVFMALRRLHPEIYYYKTKTGREVDFIVPMQGRPRMLVQVCESLAEPQTRKRETAALGEAMAELGLKTGTIVTRTGEERIKAGSGTIEAVPAWRFLLNLTESKD